MASDAPQVGSQERRKLAAEHLKRAEEGHTEVLAEVEALSADLQHFRTQIGAATGIALERL